MATLIAVSNLNANITPIVSNDQISENHQIVVEVKEPSNIEMIEVLAEKYGVDSNLALHISQCESELRQYNENGTVLRGRENPQDVGLFQINEFYHLQDSQKLGFNIYTAKGNIEYAMYIMERDGTRHWTYSKPCWGKRVGSQIALAK